MKNQFINTKLSQNYELGFISEIESEVIPKGLDENVIKLISSKKNEPLWLLEWRLESYKKWLKMERPKWANVNYPEIDYQEISYFSTPKKNNENKEIAPEMLELYKKLGVPLIEQQILAGNIAIDAVLDSVSVGTTFKEKLSKLGIIFCSFSEAVQEHPDLVKEYLGSVVSNNDNYYAALNSCVFTDGSFAYIPENVTCPMELSTYFRINQANTGQFERTLIIAEKGSYVSYLEGCFVKDTLVWTTNGIKQIQHIQLKDKVYDANGKEQSITSIMQRPYEGDFYHIDILGVQSTIEATKEHPFLIISSDKIQEIQSGKIQPEWVKAMDLHKNDFVFMPKIKKEISSNYHLTKEDVELLGYYVAKGNSYSSNQNSEHIIQFSFNFEEYFIADRVCELLYLKSNIRPFREKINNTISIKINSKKNYDWFNSQFDCINNKIQQDLLNMPIEYISIFIRAYQLGYINYLISHSDILVPQLVLLLNQINIYSNVNYIEDKKVWKIVFCNEKNIHNIIHTDLGFYVPIKNIIKRNKKQIVYNFEVATTNSYLVQGISVHNCSAPARPENQLHAAVVEIIAKESATVKYSTVQNWYPGDKDGKGGIYNFVTKRGECRGDYSHISWTQIETGSAITWKYPSIILRGNYSIGEFYSVALTNNYQQADTGTKMIHLGKNTTSTIIAKSISAKESISTYRGLVRMSENADNSKNYTQCDSLLFGNAKVYTVPYIENKNFTSEIEHEASTSKISEEQFNYLQMRGFSEEHAKNLIINGFCKDIFKKLPAEFAIEAQKLLEVNLEGSMG